MAGFGTAEKAIVNASQFSTLMGKYYQWIFVVFRFFIALSMAKSSTGDTEKDMECDTKMVGCGRMCHNKFFPMSLGRYWQFQIFCISLPAIVFMAYKVKVNSNIKQHISKQKALQKLQENGGEKKAEASETEKVLKAYDENVLDHLKFRSLQAHVPARLFLAYYFHIWARMIADICFTVYQYRIYEFKFVMPESYDCAEYPCKGGNENGESGVVTTCFIANSIQRTAFININFFLTCVTLIMSIFDLYTIGLKSVAQAWYKRGEQLAYEKDDSPTFLVNASQLNADGFINTRNLPRQASNVNNLGFVQSSGVNYRSKSTMMPRSQSILRSRSRIYR